MKDETILCIVAIICITVLEIVNLLYCKVDGTLLSAIIGAIVFVATKKKYAGYIFRSKG